MKNKREALCIYMKKLFFFSPLFSAARSCNVMRWTLILQYWLQAEFAGFRSQKLFLSTRSTLHTRRNIFCKVIFVIVKFQHVFVVEPLLGRKKLCHIRKSHCRCFRRSWKCEENIFRFTWINFVFSAYDMRTSTRRISTKSFQAAPLRGEELFN